MNIYRLKLDYANLKAGTENTLDHWRHIFIELERRRVTGPVNKMFRVLDGHSKLYPNPEILEEVKPNLLTLTHEHAITA